MASETQHRPKPFPSVAAWPPHDTEESVLGTNLHQTMITNLRWGINEAARVRTEAGQPTPWQASSQIALLGCEHFDGSPYRTYPDIFVYRHPIDPQRGSLTLVADGPPSLIIEVLSDATYEADIDVVHGKGYSYARAGVREYLVLDPTGAFLEESIRAWRLEEGVYRRWDAEADGCWHSAEIAVAFGLEGALATVYTRKGQRMLHEGEVEEALAQRDQALMRERQLRAHDQEEIQRLRRLLNEQQER